VLLKVEFVEFCVVESLSEGMEVGLIVDVGRGDGTGEIVGSRLMLGCCEIVGACVGEPVGAKLSVGPGVIVGIGDNDGLDVALVGTDGIVVAVGWTVV